MSGMNRAIFCLACGEIIDDASLADHIDDHPTHALIRYHNNIPLGGGDPVGAIISGSLNGSRRLNVDGNRTDTDTPETGTAAQPFRTIQAAIDHGVDIFARQPFTLTVEQALYGEEVVMPDFVTIDCPVGATLRRPPGPVPGDALTVTGTLGDAEPTFGATVIRGLHIVSDGDDGSGGIDESWCLRVVGDNSGGPGNTREPFVISHVCSFDAYNEGNYLYNQGGALFLTGDGGMGGDNTGGIGVKLKPLADMEAMCLTGTQMISFGYIGLEIYENSFFVGNGTRFQAMSGHSEPSPTCIKMDATAGFSLVSIYQPSQMFGDPEHLIQAIGSGIGGGGPSGLITLHGGYNDIFDGVGGDAVNVSDGILFRFVDGGIRSAGGRGIIINDAIMWIRNANVVSGDGLALDASGDDCHIDSIDTTWEGHVAGGAYGNCVRVDVDAPTVKFNGGRMTGDGTVLDLRRGSMFLTGGVDIDPQNPLSTAYNVEAGAQLQRGHCNVRRGLRTLAPTAAEHLLPSGFGELQVGYYNCIAKIGSSLTAPPGGDGWEQGSLWIWPGNGVFQNAGTEAAPDWVQIGSMALLDFDRVQLDTCGTQEFGSHTEGSPKVLPFANTPILDDPPYTVISPGVIQVEEEDNYRLSYSLPFEQDTAILLDGFSGGACWQYSTDSGISWIDFVQTKTFDTIHGIFDDHGAFDLPPIEIFLAAETQLRVVVFNVGSTGTVYINSNAPVHNWAWARIERVRTGLSAAALVWDAGNPNGALTGVAGQMYRDTVSGLYYICRSNGLMVWDLL